MKTAVIRWEDERGEEREMVGTLVRLGEEAVHIDGHPPIPNERIISIEITRVS